MYGFSAQEKISKRIDAVARDYNESDMLSI